MFECRENVEEQSEECVDNEFFNACCGITFEYFGMEEDGAAVLEAGCFDQSACLDEGDGSDVRDGHVVCLECVLDFGEDGIESVDLCMEEVTGAVGVLILIASFIFSVSSSCFEFWWL